MISCYVVKLGVKLRKVAIRFGKRPFVTISLMTGGTEWQEFQMN